MQCIYLLNLFYHPYSLKLTPDFKYALLYVYVAMQCNKKQRHKQCTSGNLYSADLQMRHQKLCRPYARAELLGRTFCIINTAPEWKAWEIFRI